MQNVNSRHAQQAKPADKKGNKEFFTKSQFHLGLQIKWGNRKLIEGLLIGQRYHVRCTIGRTSEARRSGQSRSHRSIPPHSMQSNV